MTHTSSLMPTTPLAKKSRRFSLIRIFNHHSSNNLSSSNATSSSSSGASSEANSPSMDSGVHYRHSMEPTMDAMQSEIMHERRKSIAALTECSFRSMSLDLRPSAIRPILSNSRKETPQIEMNEKMRQFDELLHTRRSSTIRMTLTPTLLQEP